MIKSVQVLAGLSDKSRNLASQVAAILGREYKLVNAKPDLIVVVGGDGTLLHWLHDLNYPTTPFLGIEGGNLSYFSELSVEKLAASIKNIKADRYKLQKLPLLEARIGKKIISHAFNEFAVERASARAIHLAISIDDYKFEKYIGDGLIISSPQGSTAYSGAAGGAILPYDLSLFEVVPSNPHQSAIYKALRQPLVLGGKSHVKVEVLDPKNRPVRVVSDGHEVIIGNIFEIGMSSKAVTMLRTHDFNFYQRLSLKLIG